MVILKVCILCFVMLSVNNAQRQDGNQYRLRRNVPRSRIPGHHSRSPQVKTSPVDEAAPKASKPKPKPSPGPKALTINYPLSMFNLEAESSDWHSIGVVDENLKSKSADRTTYKKIAHAQSGEDIWLYENWFYGVKNGLILESGALDGTTFSTSYMFETFADWTSVHVEADSKNYNDLIVNRENSINVHGAFCSEPRLLHYSSVGVDPVRGFVEFMAPSFLERWHHAVFTGEIPLESLPTVQCLPVKTLLKELHINHIDIWVLDVEGAEESALLGTDFNKVKINAIAMECDKHDGEKNARKMKMLEEKGYSCTNVKQNCMCKHKDYVPSASPYRKNDTSVIV